MGRERKLDSKDEFLLTFMKLRLGLLNKDLAQPINISKSLVTNTFHSWLRATAEYLNAFVYMPDTEHILGTTPQRFREFKNLCGIIDCLEIFIETPKGLETQSAIWSEYKHHNTVKFLFVWYQILELPLFHKHILEDLFTENNIREWFS